MTMNKAFFLRKEDVNPQWHLIDAEGVVLGRLATQVADMLRGKDKPFYTPHTDCGDYVVIVNADKIILSGNKWKAKEYISHSGWQSGKKITTAREMLKKHPTYLVEYAVKRMLPKNKLNKEVFKKLKVYVGSEHPHKAQDPQKMDFVTQRPRKS